MHCHLQELPVSGFAGLQDELQRSSHVLPPLDPMLRFFCPVTQGRQPQRRKHGKPVSWCSNPNDPFFPERDVVSHIVSHSPRYIWRIFDEHLMFFFVSPIFVSEKFPFPVQGGAHGRRPKIRQKHRGVASRGCFLGPGDMECDWCNMIWVSYNSG